MPNYAYLTIPYPEILYRFEPGTVASEVWCVCFHTGPPHYLYVFLCFDTKSKKKFICNSQNFKDILQGFNNEKDKETLEKHGFFLTLKTLKEKNRLFLCEKMKYFSSIFSCTAQKLLVK